MQLPESSRRQFLRLAGGAAVGFVVMRITGCESNSVDPITAGAEVPFLTPLSSFYYKNGAEGSIPRWSMPVISTNDWRLMIDGEVATPLSVRYQDILADEVDHTIKLLKTMRCVIDSNEVQGLVGTAVWTGVPLRLYLDRAGIDTGRTLRLRFHGADGFTNNLKLAAVYGAPRPGVVEPLLVTHINGLPLPERHGYPLRLIVHEAYGFKSVKWLTRIEATTSDTPFGTYQDQGFNDDGEMRVNSRMTSPISNVTLPAGTLRCVGFAVGGAEGIERIEISVDDGPFQIAEIMTQADAIASNSLLQSTVQVAQPNAFTYPYRAVWAQWQFVFTAAPGTHTIRIRATDRAGNTQPDADSDISDGINAVSAIQITAV